jgi:ankyrin repeat protein
MRTATHALFAQDGDTPLHMAAQYGTEECVRVLVQRGADAAAKNKARHAAAAAAVPPRPV